MTSMVRVTWQPWPLIAARFASHAIDCTLDGWRYRTIFQTATRGRKSRRYKTIDCHLSCPVTFSAYFSTRANDFNLWVAANVMVGISSAWCSHILGQTNFRLQLIEVISTPQMFISVLVRISCNSSWLGLGERKFGLSRTRCLVGQSMCPYIKCYQLY